MIAMSNINPTFNNQINVNNPGAYVFTQSLKKQIVKQLEGKTSQEQEQIIGTLLEMLDVNLLAALYMAYGSAKVGEEKAK